MSRSDICAITSYFNPSNYKIRPATYDIFRQELAKTNVPLYTIECVFGEQAPVFELDDTAFRVRSQSILWQKERLLNLLIQRLPEKYTKIAWLDADLIFLNKNWANETSELLDQFVVVQPYEYAERLAPNQIVSTRGNLRAESYGKVYVKNLKTKPEVEKFGYVGYAWAAQREFLDTYGMYDAAIDGSGDTIFAYTTTGHFSQPAILDTYKSTENHLRHVQEWMFKAYESIRGSLSFTPGLVLHLWHGSQARRLYIERTVQLNLLDFDPYTDIVVSPNGCWEWNSDKPKLHKWFITYFNLRSEDGN
jgi:hypothetical protein